MAFEDYDISKAFERIEDELISSMMRNLRRHLQEEDKLGFDWSQWQVEQLRYLQEYRKRNKKKFGPQFKEINKKVVEAIRDAAERGGKDEEKNILKQLTGEKAKPRRRRGDASVEGAGDAFFRINDKKLEALVKAANDDLTRAEHAVLRRSNDQYRKIIYDAQVYANTGAGTIEQAIDMATKDFLSRGIDCIEYKNGARHTIKDYADMYIRTAERRAYLMGEGSKRQEWGEELVIVNKRGGHPCLQCIPWLGKVLIDDVYSGGKPDGKHRLLSDAMAAGFLHPRCKDGFTTYFPGISSAPDPDAVTKKDLQKAVKVEKEEARESYAQRQVEKFERLAEYSLNPENQQKYKARTEEWKKSVQFMASDNNGNDWTKTTSRFVEKQEMRSYREIAKETNVNLADISTFDGDPELFIGSIQRLSELQIKYPLRRKISLGISKILGDDDFAVKNNRTLLLNRVVLRNRTVTKDNIRRGRRFASRTFKDIVVHEYGHFMEEQFGRVTIDMVEKAMYNLNIKDNPLAYLYKNISKYSISIDTRHNGSKYFKDLSSEILVIHERKPTEFTKELIRIWTGGYYEKS